MKQTGRVKFLLLLTTCLFIVSVPSRLSSAKLIFLGIYVVSTNEIMNEDWEISGDGGVRIEGGVRLATDGYNIDIGETTVGVEFDVQGQFDVNSGLGGDSTITNSGTFNSQGTVKIYNHSEFHNRNDATVNVSGGTLQVDGLFDNGSAAGNAANFNVTNGTLQISTEGRFRNAYKCPGNLTISGGTFSLEGGSLVNTYNTNQGNLSISGCNFTLDGGEISKVGTDLKSIISIYGADLDIAALETTPLISNGCMTLPPGATTLSIPTLRIFTLGNNGSLTTHRQIINNGILTIDGALSIESDGYLNNKYLINNNNLLVRYPGGLFTGGFTNHGTFLDYDQTSNEVEPDVTTFIPIGFELITPQGNNLYINGQLTNRSPNSWDIYGTVYTYGIIENGYSGSAGAINILFPGELYLLGETLTNNHANSVVNIESGGSLYNYYGVVDLETGGADSLDVKAGGKFYNARGNNPGTFTLNSGCTFLDMPEIHLGKDLDVDYTWTITEPAIVRGYGNEIRLGENGAIVIDGATASLLLDDVIIRGVGGNKIRATDTNSTLSIGDVAWVQDNNVSYTWGNIFINGEWVIAGDGTTFEYATNQTSTIDSNGSIKCQVTTFEYNTDNANRINMVDEGAVINLDHGALLATQALTLANGTLITTGSSSFVGTALLDLQNVAGINSDSATITIGDVII